MPTLPPLKQQLTELVALPSVSSTSPQWDMGNRQVIELLATWLADLGFATEIIPVEGAPQKANLIAGLGRGPGGLVLSGHTDTVPYDENRWHQDPFKLTEQDQRWFGLGATDMKGFFPVALAAIQSVIGQSGGQALKQPLIVLATADEESSMSGARALAAMGKPQGRYAVIGEPTGLKPIRMHKGIMMEAVRVQGEEGHSSNPGLGSNALEIMNCVITDLLAFREELQRRHQHPGFTVEVPTLNLGHIHGGDNPNRICGSCELHFDLRLLPGMALTELHQQLAERVAKIGSASNTVIELSKLIAGVEPFEQAADSTIVTAVEQVSGQSAGSVAFATEAPFLQQLGMETVIFGPGAIDQAHQPNEYIELGQIQPAIDMLSKLIARFCL